MDFKEEERKYRKNKKSNTANNNSVFLDKIKNSDLYPSEFRQLGEKIDANLKENKKLYIFLYVLCLCISLTSSLLVHCSKTIANHVHDFASVGKMDVLCFVIPAIVIFVLALYLWQFLFLWGIDSCRRIYEGFVLKIRDLRNFGDYAIEAIKLTPYSIIYYFTIFFLLVTFAHLPKPIAYIFYFSILSFLIPMSVQFAIFFINRKYLKKWSVFLFVKTVLKSGIFFKGPFLAFFECLGYVLIALFLFFVSGMLGLRYLQWFILLVFVYRIFSFCNIFFYGLFVTALSQKMQNHIYNDIKEF